MGSSTDVKVINTRDVITFQADSVENAIAEFHASVDDYLEIYAERGEDPEKPLTSNLNSPYRPKT